MKSCNFSNILKWALLVICIVHSTLSDASFSTCTGGYFPVCANNSVTHSNRFYRVQKEEPDIEISYPGRCRSAFHEKSCPEQGYSEDVTGYSLPAESHYPSSNHDPDDDDVIYFYEYLYEYE